MTGKQISALELYTKINQGLNHDEIIIDVRTPDECAKGMIATAKNIPINELGAHLDELRQYQKIYLYCLSGGRSQLALLELEAAGLAAEIYSLTSGLLAWRAAQYPTTNI